MSNCVRREQGWERRGGWEETRGKKKRGGKRTPYLCIACLWAWLSISDAETALKMMMMTGPAAAAAVPLAALQAAGHRQRVQAAAAASYLTSAGLRHVAPLGAITPQTMCVHTTRTPTHGQVVKGEEYNVLREECWSGDRLPYLGLEPVGG